jgi:hypothetical protein
VACDDTGVSSGEYDLSRDVLCFENESLLLVLIVGLGVVLGDGFVTLDPSDEDVLEAETRCIFILL